MKKILIIFFSLLFLAGCTVYQTTNGGIDQPKATPKFTVSLANTHEVIFTENDLESYDPASSTFTFTKEGVKKMQSYQKAQAIAAGLYQKPFIIELDGKKLYEGKFWSNLSSSSEPGIVLGDIVVINPENPSLTLSKNYPGYEKIDDKELREFFEKIGKLKS